MKAKRRIAWILSFLMVFSLIMGTSKMQVFAAGDAEETATFVIRESNGQTGTVQYKLDSGEFTVADSTPVNLSGVSSITIKATPVADAQVNQSNSGITGTKQAVSFEYAALTDESGWTYYIQDGDKNITFTIEFDNHDGTGGGDNPQQSGPSIAFFADSSIEGGTLAVNNGIFTLSKGGSVLGTFSVTLVDIDNQETAYAGNEASIPLNDISSVKIVMRPEEGMKAKLITGGDTPEGALSERVFNIESDTYTYTAYPSQFGGEQKFLAVNVWFGESEDDINQVDFTAVIWDGDQVENKSEHGSITVSSVVIGSTTYTYKGNGKFENNDTETDLIEWYGYNKTSTNEEAGVRIMDAAFDDPSTEVYINFVFKPDYGYQVTGIGTNEYPTSLADAGFSASETISTFRFKVIQHNNPHFAVVFSESPDIINVSGAKDVNAAKISNGQNATDSGNLKLTVNDLSESEKAEAQSQFAEHIQSGDSDVLYLDADLFQVVSKGTTGNNWENKLTDLTGDITVTLELSDEFKNMDGTFYVIRQHEDANGTKTYTRIEAVYNKAAGTVTFATNKFSTYALVLESEADFSNITDPANNACNADLAELTDDLISKLLTEAEKTRLENGEEVKVWLEVTDISASVSQTDKDLIDSKKGNATIGMYLDIDLLKQIGSDSPVNITETNGAVTITLKVPSSLINSNSSVTRTYQMIRVHNGVATVIPCTYNAANQTISCETDQFSTYALAYVDQQNNSGGGNTGGGSSTDGSNNNVKDEVPKTGDASNAYIWFILALVSGIGALYFGKKGLVLKKEN
ncbi:MAG: LPXTG cell wall anchor domain-containing protein [Bacillota bacterium]|nr:LPXTG cell wall anchor domain-containing protein [Bacillota bacterium]